MTMKQILRGRLPGVMQTKLEQRYDELLGQRLAAGEILWYRYEGIRLRLGKNSNYTPDFALMRADGQLELHEVKGSWQAKNQRDGKTKLRVAAGMYPFTFFGVTYDRRLGWQFQEF